MGKEDSLAEGLIRYSKILKKGVESRRLKGKVGGFAKIVHTNLMRLLDECVGPPVPVTRDSKLRRAIESYVDGCDNSLNVIAPYLERLLRDHPPQEGIFISAADAASFYHAMDGGDMDGMGELMGLLKRYEDYEED